MSQFRAGDEFTFAGVQYRVVRGRRCDGDLILQFRLPGSDWHTPAIAHTLILTALKWQVEENNYGADGKVKHGQGGWYLFDRITDAALNDWRGAADKTTREAETAKERRNDLVQDHLGLPG